MMTPHILKARPLNDNLKFKNLGNFEKGKLIKNKDYPYFTRLSIKRLNRFECLFLKKCYNIKILIVNE